MNSKIWTKDFDVFDYNKESETFRSNFGRYQYGKWDDMADTTFAFYILNVEEYDIPENSTQSDKYESASDAFTTYAFGTVVQRFDEKDGTYNRRMDYKYVSIYLKIYPYTKVLDKMPELKNLERISNKYEMVGIAVFEKKERIYVLFRIYSQLKYCLLEDVNIFLN